MRIQDIKYVLASLGVPHKNGHVTKKFFNVSCPFAPYYHASGKDTNPSFGISYSEASNKRSYYNCFSCGQKGSFAVLPAKLGALRKKDYSALVAEAERLEYAAVSRSFVSWDADNEHTEQAKKIKEDSKQKSKTYSSALGLRYLRKRGYTWIDAWRLGLQYDEFQQRVLFPVFDRNLSLHGYTGRLIRDSTDKKNPKTRDYHGLQKENYFLFNPLFYKNRSKQKLVLVEGAFDYARGQQAGYIGTHANLGTAHTEPKLSWITGLGRPVYLFFDNDLAGISAMYGKFNRQSLKFDDSNGWAPLLATHIPVWVCQYPSTASKDPDSLTVQEFRLAVKRAVLYTEAHRKSVEYRLRDHYKDLK
jgi:hypothetical protein